jgi:tetrahydromethanopterin S-methyltransferase subunit C
MYLAWMMGEVTSGKITELALYTTMLWAIDTVRKIALYEQAFSSK